MNSRSLLCLSSRGSEKGQISRLFTEEASSVLGVIRILFGINLLPDTSINKHLLFSLTASCRQDPGEKIDLFIFLIEINT